VAGGALVHPLLPVFMSTPICALSLSARPILFPNSANLTIELKGEYDESPVVTFDGTQPEKLQPTSASSSRRRRTTSTRP